MNGLGKLYTIKTSVPLLQTFEADIPIEVMTADALQVVREDAKSALPWVIAGGAIVAALGTVIGAALVVRKKW